MLFNQLEFDGLKVVPAERRVVVTPDESPTGGKTPVYTHNKYASLKCDLLLELRLNWRQSSKRRVLRYLRSSHEKLISMNEISVAEPNLGICKRCKKGHAYEIRLSGQSIVNCVRMWEESPDSRFESIGRDLREYSIYCTYCY